MSKKIPLRDKNGNVKAFAIVDDEDFAPLSRWRWHLTDGGYARRMVVVEGRAIHLGMHRQILALGLPREDPRVPDHINGDPLDNRRSNLRAVTRAQNQQNLRSSGGKSPHRGVVFHSFSGLWQARAKVNGKWHSGGYFKTDDEAAVAAIALRARLMPFANESRASA